MIHDSKSHSNTQAKPYSIKTSYRKLRNTLLHLLHPRFHTRYYNRMRRFEVTIATLRRNVSFTPKGVSISDIKKKLTRYDEVLNRLRRFEALEQTDPERLSLEDRAWMKKSRQGFNDDALVMAEGRAELALAEESEIRLVNIERRSRILRRVYVFLTACQYLALTAIIFQFTVYAWNSSIFSRLLSYFTSDSHFIRALGLMAAGVVGTGLYFMRSKWRRLYACTELALALASIWSAMGDSRIVDDTTKRLALAGSVYIFVRGLDNLKQGQMTVARIQARRTSIMAARTKSNAAKVTPESSEAS